MHAEAEHEAGSVSRARVLLGRVDRTLDRCLMDIVYMGNRIRQLQAAVDSLEDMILGSGSKPSSHSTSPSFGDRKPVFMIDRVPVQLSPMLACIFRALLMPADSDFQAGSETWVSIESLRKKAKSEFSRRVSRHDIINAVYRLRQRLRLAGVDASILEQNNTRGYRIHQGKHHIVPFGVVKDR